MPAGPASSRTGDIATASAIARAGGDGAGTISWQRLLGGNDIESGGNSARQTADGGYVLLGSSASSASGDVTGANHGGSDLWAVKLNGTGTISWQKILGGDRGETGYSVQQTADGDYVLLGSSDSSASGDVTGTNHDIHHSSDLWVVKLQGAAPTPTPTAAERYQVVSTWGTSGTGPGQFMSPGGIAVDSASNVYVADTGNNRVQKFDANGTFLSLIGGLGGTGIGQFMGPGGIVGDNASNVYVADTSNNRVQTFTSNGTYLAQFGLGSTDYGVFARADSSENGQFNGPRGIAVDSA